MRFWTTAYGYVYHTSRNCPGLVNAKDKRIKTVVDRPPAHTRCCKLCERRDAKRRQDKAPH